MKEIWILLKLLEQKKRKILWVMKLSIFFVLFFSLSVSATVSAQQERVNLHLENVSLKTFFHEIQKQTGLYFVYNEEICRDFGKVSVDATDKAVTAVLKNVFTDKAYSYHFEDKIIVVKAKTLAEPQQKMKKVKGRVTDSKGNPLPGVGIIIEGTTVGTTTDVDGNYVINCPAKENLALLFSFVGMKTKKEVVGNRLEISVKMEEEVEEMEEVVVTGIFKKNKEAYTGAVTVITDNELKIAGNKNLLTSISNIDPAFNMLVNNEFGSDPNHMPEIQIRGASNLPSLENLQDNTRTDLNLPLIIMDGFEIDLKRMMDMNSNEVASITLLKDGTATAIYGSRGANGVVVITTKEPEMGKLKLTYNGSLNLEVPDLSAYHLLNAEDKLALELKMGYYESNNLAQDLLLKNKYAQRLQDVRRGVDTYWLAKPLRTGVGHRHSLRLEGGDKSFRYAASIQYNNVAGVMKESARNSFNGGIDLSYHHQKMIFRNSLAIGWTKSNDSPYGSFSDYTRLNSYWKPYDDNGDLIKIFDNDVEFYGGFGNLPQNPLYNAMLNFKKEKKYTDIINNFSIECRPFDGFIVRGKVGIFSQITENDEYKSAKHSDFEAEEYLGDEGIFRKGNYRYSSGREFNYDLSLTVSYAKTLAQRHWLYVGLNADLTSGKSREYTFEVEGFVEESLDFLSSALQYKKDGKPFGREATTRRIGIVGNLNYSYNNCYYVDFAYRTDGSSQFGKDKKFAPFYSIGLGWNVNKMEFMKNVDFVDLLKFRASFGQTGSQKFDAYQAKATYGYYLNDRYFQWMGSYQKALENSRLEWQKTNKWNAGVEINLLMNRLNFIADVYFEKTSNLLSSLDLPYSNGFVSYVENVGGKENKGFEMKLSGYLIRNTEKRIIWSVTGALVHNKDKIVKLSSALKSMYDKLLSEGGSLPNAILREGESQNSIYAVPSLGIDPGTGKELFLKKNGQVSHIWDANDRVFCGISEPKYRGNFSTMFRLKDFSLNLSFAYRLGGQLYNSTLVSKVENADKRFNVDERVMKDRWQNVGDNVSFKSLWDESVTNSTSRFVQDERTLICQNLHLSYELQNKLWMQKNLGIQSLTISSDISDLFYKSSIKQERGLTYPFARRFSFSLSMLF